jgi:uncharacterized protein DUF4242
MPRYLVERTFPDGVRILGGVERRELGFAAIERNAADGVTWVHSYVSEDDRRTFCVLEADSPEAIRATAARSGLPVDRITQVRLLDPYFYS